MKPFPYDELKPIFRDELKALFVHFIDKTRKRKPYIFTLMAPDYIAYNHPKSWCLGANGNTMVALKKQIESDETGDMIRRIIAKFESDDSEKEFVDNMRRILAIDDTLADKYAAELWRNRIFTLNDFPGSNAMILEYIRENEDDIADDDAEFTEEFEEFRTAFFDFLVRSLKQLRDEKFFESVYPERILINFEVNGEGEGEYFEKEQMLRIFEELNSKEEAEEYSKFLFGDKKPETAS